MNHIECFNQMKVERKNKRNEKYMTLKDSKRIHEHSMFPANNIKQSLKNRKGERTLTNSFYETNYPLI